MEEDETYWSGNDESNCEIFTIYAPNNNYVFLDLYQIYNFLIKILGLDIAETYVNHETNYNYISYRKNGKKNRRKIKFYFAEKCTIPYKSEEFEFNDVVVVDAEEINKLLEKRGYSEYKDENIIYLPGNDALNILEQLYKYKEMEKIKPSYIT